MPEMLSDIKFKCTSCQQPLEAPRDMCGTEIGCPICHHKMTVPGMTIPLSDKSSSRRNLSILLVALIALLVAMASLFRSRHSLSPPSPGLSERISAIETAVSRIRNDSRGRGDATETRQIAERLEALELTVKRLESRDREMGTRSFSKASTKPSMSRAEWKAKAKKHFRIIDDGYIFEAPLGRFKEVMGDPDRTQTLGSGFDKIAYWHYNCSDGTIVLKLAAGILADPGIVEGDINEW